MQRGEVSNVRYYALNCGEALPNWIAPNKRNAVKKDEDLRRKIDLIQEFEMPDLSTAVKMTPIGDHILATGVYKPRVKCYDTSNLAIKFDRCMDSEVITFEIVSQSYDKLVFLQEDRYIELHNKPGRLDRFRIPFFGRDISIDPSTAMLYCVGNRPDIVRFNLDQGQFLPSLTSQASEINTCTYNPNFYYTAFGTREGTVEAWDPRARSRISVLDLSYGNLRLKKGDLPSVTSLQFDSTGLSMAVGTQTGHIMLYDIRGGKPLSTLSNYMKPVIKTAFHKDYLLTLDETALQLWPQNALHGEDVSPFLSLRSDNRLTDFCAVKDSGLVFLTGETQLMKVFFVPAVGPSPTWCHYLDNLIHELEEAPEEVVYSDYKFVTEEDLTKLQATSLIGTNLVDPHSHGYYLNLGLYQQLQREASNKNPHKDKKNLVKLQIAAMKTDLKEEETSSNLAKILPNGISDSNGIDKEETQAAEPPLNPRASVFSTLEDKTSRLANFQSQFATVPLVESKENKIKKKKYKGKKKSSKAS